jgi:lipopolysaccharide export LptBFGC system permease protein LptF
LRPVNSTGEREMFTTKLNVLAPSALAALGVVILAIEPAFAGTPVPTPIIGAGLPAIAVLAGGYWLIRKFRGSR